jgi:transcription elongation GreA/GreB family factor
MDLYFTKKGIIKYQEYVRSLDEAVKNLQSGIAEAAEIGGDIWHDNFSYEQLRLQVSTANTEYLRAYRNLQSAKIVDLPKNVDSVCLGCEVDLIINGKNMAYKILGFGESNPEQSIIAYNTPIAKVIMNKKPGYIYEGTIGEIYQKIKVLAVRPVKEEDN